MGSINFSKYLYKFETELVAKGVSEGIIGKESLVNVREGKFACTKFARHLGTRVESDVPFVIDYYGYLKRSNGFDNLIKSKEIAIRNRQIKSIYTTVVYFASLKIEEIAEITSSQYLKSWFPEFKKDILYRRNFEKRKKTTEEQTTARSNRRVAV
jgi:hypothetical protein